MARLKHWILSVVFVPGLIWLFFFGNSRTSFGNQPSATPPPDSLVTFTNHIAPLLKANCQPCHFPGGKVYEKYPFEKYETAFRLRKRLGTRLSTPDQQKLLRLWMDGGARE